MTVNCRKLNILLSFVGIEVEQGHSPLRFVLVPSRLSLDFLQLLVAHRNLDHSVRKLQVLVEIPNSLEKVLLVKLALSLKVFDFNL